MTTDIVNVAAVITCNKVSQLTFLSVCVSMRFLVLSGTLRPVLIFEPSPVLAWKGVFTEIASSIRWFVDASIWMPLMRCVGGTRITPSSMLLVERNKITRPKLIAIITSDTRWVLYCLLFCVLNFRLIVRAYLLVVIHLGDRLRS
jgi:hypothetical protein